MEQKKKQERRPISKKKFQRLHFLAAKVRKSTLKRDGEEDFEYLELWRQFASGPCPELEEPEPAPLIANEAGEIITAFRLLSWGVLLKKDRKLLIKRIKAFPAWVLAEIDRIK